MSSAAGIIAAGDGSRLLAAGRGALKPLVQVSGKPLVHWVASGLRSAGADSITVLLNSRGTPVREYLERAFPELAWTFLQRDTASSWESFRLVSRELARSSERFLLSTVDALIPPAEAARFAAEAAAAEAALALTSYVEDEKPLWADLDRSGRVVALGDDARRREFVTCGLYALSRDVARAMPEAGAFGRLRDFWAGLVRGGRDVRGVPLSDTVDVDRPEDLAAAERLTSCFDA